MYRAHSITFQKTRMDSFLNGLKSKGIEMVINIQVLIEFEPFFFPLCFSFERERSRNVVKHIFEYWNSPWLSVCNRYHELPNLETWSSFYFFFRRIFQLKKNLWSSSREEFIWLQSSFAGHIWKRNMVVSPVSSLSSLY